MHDILQKAYSYTDISEQTLTPEMAIIRYIFITPDNLKAMGDSRIFLSFIENVVKERYNVSFPEDFSLCQIYLNDCVRLKNELQQSQIPSWEERWLSYTIRLLENIKTPYYSCYAKCLRNITTQIREEKIADFLLGTFYGLMIKSQKEQLDVMEQIAEAIKTFTAIEGLEEKMLSNILVENLMLLAQEKSCWTEELARMFIANWPVNHTGSVPRMTLVKLFLEKEIIFTGTPQALSAKSLGEYLAERTLWMSEHKLSMEQGMIFERGFAGKSQLIDSEFLNTYAYNMNETSYLTNPAVGREHEIEDLALILISPKKSPLLLGEAGVGKTSVVEGLAWNLKNGTVPNLLKDKKILKLTTSALLSDTKYVGEMEARMKQLTGELRKHPEVILFIDEIHTIVGAGSTESSNNDIANMLKPYIDRGEIKLIGATTRAEYEEFIAKDKALSRRFYPIYIDEPDEETTVQILKETLPAIEYETQVKNNYNMEETEQILRELTQLCRRENQIEELALYRPELPLTLLEMGFSYAALENRDCFLIQNLQQAILHSSRLKKEVREQAFQYFIL